MPEPRRTVTPPRDRAADLVCLLDNVSRASRSEPPEAFLALARRIDIENGAEFRFDAADGMWERLSTFVAEERECCPFFAFEQWEEPGEVVLKILRPREEQ